MNFRRQFRIYRTSIGVTNNEIGTAIDNYCIAENSDGLTEVQNALAPQRKLTHRVARIITAGLILAGEDSPMRNQNKRLALLVLGGAMYANRAWNSKPAVPAFIPLEAIDDLAAWLAPKSKNLRIVLSERLRSEAPAMGLAWCEHVRRTPLRGTSAQILDFVNQVESLVRTEFDGISPERVLNLGSEFEIVNRERPDLTQDFLREFARAHSIDGRE